jgi:hypothetical protein
VALRVQYQGVPVIYDPRLKTDILRVGQFSNGIALYRFRYIWSDKLFAGVMAQEAAVRVPDAVSRGSDGYFRVDYQRLGNEICHI